MQNVKSFYTIFKWELGWCTNAGAGKLIISKNYPVEAFFAIFINTSFTALGTKFSSSVRFRPPLIFANGCNLNGVFSKS